MPSPQRVKISTFSLWGTKSQSGQRYEWGCWYTYIH